MNITCFDDLLRMARQQSQPQRLLFAFVTADLPEDSTPAQRERFLAGQGGALVPLMCVDKSPDELQDFAALSQESMQFAKPWDMVFVSTLSATGSGAPSEQAAEQALNRMVESIKMGALDNMIPFDRQGQPVVLA